MGNQITKTTYGCYLPWEDKYTLEGYIDLAIKKKCPVVDFRPGLKLDYSMISVWTVLIPANAAGQFINGEKSIAFLPNTDPGRMVLTEKSIDAEGFTVEYDGSVSAGKKRALGINEWKMTSEFTKEKSNVLGIILETTDDVLKMHGVEYANDPVVVKSHIKRIEFYPAKEIENEKQKNALIRIIANSNQEIKFHNYTLKGKPDYLIQVIEGFPWIRGINDGTAKTRISKISERILLEKLTNSSLFTQLEFNDDQNVEQRSPNDPQSACSANDHSACKVSNHWLLLGDKSDGLYDYINRSDRVIITEVCNSYTISAGHVIMPISSDRQFMVNKYVFFVKPVTMKTYSVDPMMSPFIILDVNNKKVQSFNCHVYTQWDQDTVPGKFNIHNSTVSSRHYKVKFDNPLRCKTSTISRAIVFCSKVMRKIDVTFNGVYKSYYIDFRGYVFEFDQQCRIVIKFDGSLFDIKTSRGKKITTNAPLTAVTKRRFEIIETGISPMECDILKSMDSNYGPYGEYGLLRINGGNFMDNEIYKQFRFREQVSAPTAQTSVVEETEFPKTTMQSVPGSHEDVPPPPYAPGTTGLGE